MQTPLYDLSPVLHIMLMGVVVALGPLQLLHGLAVVGVLDVAALAAIYGRCVREVQAGRTALSGGNTSSTDLRRSRKGPAGMGLHEEIDALAQEIDSMLAADIIGPVLRPLESAATQLSELAKRLDGISPSAGRHGPCAGGPDDLRERA